MTYEGIANSDLPTLRRERPAMARAVSKAHRAGSIRALDAACNKLVRIDSRIRELEFVDAVRVWQDAEIARLLRPLAP